MYSQFQVSTPDHRNPFLSPHHLDAPRYGFTNTNKLPSLPVPNAHGHEAREVLSIPISELSLATWQPPAGVDITLRVHFAERSLSLELSAPKLGWYKLVIDFGDISTLSLVDSEYVSTVELGLLRDPARYRGNLVTYPHQEIAWTPETDAYNHSVHPHDLTPLTIRTRSDLISGPLRFLIDKDYGIKTAYQNGCQKASSYHDKFMAHNYSTSSQIARQSMENLTSLMNSAAAHIPAPTSSPPVYKYSPPPPASQIPQPILALDETTLASVRFKPTECSAKSLRIGTWEKKGYCAGDLKCKFLYVKKRVVWEVIDVMGLIKIEICFKDISAISVQQTEKEMIMHVEIAKLPFFYRGFLQKMKNTRWVHTADVTGGQASLCRTHVLHFPKNILPPHLERLIQSDAHIRQIANVTPQMFASYRAHQQSCNTTFTSVVPSSYSIAHPSLPLSSSHSPVSGNSPPLAKDASSHSVACGCTTPGQCAGKICACTKDGSWCGKQCRCQGACSNPANQHLTSCARQTFLQQSLHTRRRTKPLEINLDRSFRLPCRCSSALLRQLTSPYECVECGQQFIYSFCFKSVVSVDAVWHCEACGVCKDFRESHCDECGKCSFTNADGDCRSCTSGARGSERKSECVIS